MWWRTSLPDILPEPKEKELKDLREELAAAKEQSQALLVEAPSEVLGKRCSGEGCFCLLKCFDRGGSWAPRREGDRGQGRQEEK